MPVYIHQLPKWPQFTWDYSVLANRLASVRNRQGLLIGQLRSLGFSLQEEAVLHTLTDDILKSSEIEGEILDRQQVRSSIARRLGIEIGSVTPVGKDVEGIVDMVFDATQRYNEELTPERLFGWHAALFPTGYSGMKKIRVGDWRKAEDGTMQVVSGPIGRERVHFEAPTADRIENEMELFFHWFNSEDDTDPVLRAGIAHLWFITIHPFEDGNGRMARAIADMMLARSENSPKRFYSMSAQVHKEREAYYEMLEDAQKGTLDITEALLWFLDCLDRAFNSVESTLASVLQKSRFWDRHRNKIFNERQRLMITKLFEGFEGNLTSTKWAKITKCSHDTALRDIMGLVEQGVLRKEGSGGRNTNYTLNADE